MTRQLFLGSILVAILLPAAFAQPQSQIQVDDLENRVTKIEDTLEDVAGAGFVFFLFGAFCALWAQNSGRSAWLWFFLGVIFNFITVLVLLSKNSDDRKASRTSVPPS